MIDRKKVEGRPEGGKIKLKQYTLNIQHPDQDMTSISVA